VLAMGDVEANLDKALNDLRIYDLAIDLHGSRAVGIHQPNSNVDVLITRPLQGLLHELEEHGVKQSRFEHVRTVPAGPPWYQPSMMQLHHIPTSIKLDLISRWSADIFVRERDAVAHICLKKDDRVQGYLELVLKWAKRRRDFLPVDQGYPTVYCFRIMALHFLMSRVWGVILPPLTANGSFLDDNAEKYVPAKKDKVTASDDLAVEFLDYLGKCAKPDMGIWASLRKPMEAGPPGVWQVIDPPSHKKLLHLTEPQINEIGKIATLDGKNLRNNKGALDAI